MTAESVSGTSGNAAWMLMAASLVLLMTPGLAFFYGGMSRQKSVLNMMMMSFGAIGVVGIIYVLWGWSMSYGHQSFGGIFANPAELFGMKDAIVDDRGNYVTGTHGYANVIDIGFQLACAGISAALISGALAERVKFGTWLVFVAVWETLVYFPLSHMVWGGGFLSGSKSGLSALLFGSENGEAVIEPIDFAGGTVIHISAGAAAFALVLLIGKRKSFMKTPHRPHNLPLVMVGTALLWFGWFGFNAGSAFAANGLAGLSWLNTTVAASAGMLGWLGLERLRDGHATSLGAASGVVAGLVAITPAAGALTPVTSIVLGLIGGMLACWGVGLKYKFGFDDTLDVVGLHLIAAIWGTIGVGLFARHDGLLMGGGLVGLKLLIIQTLIAVIAVVFAGAFTLAIGFALRWSMGWRVDDDHEATGIDVVLHGESAYDTTGPDIRT